MEHRDLLAYIAALAIYFYVISGAWRTFKDNKKIKEMKIKPYVCKMKTLEQIAETVELFTSQLEQHKKLIDGLIESNRETREVVFYGKKAGNCDAPIKQSELSQSKDELYRAAKLFAMRVLSETNNVVYSNDKRVQDFVNVIMTRAHDFSTTNTFII